MRCWGFRAVATAEVQAIADTAYQSGRRSCTATAATSSPAAAKLARVADQQQQLRPGRVKPHQVPRGFMSIAGRNQEQGYRR